MFIYIIRTRKPLTRTSVILHTLFAGYTGVYLGILFSTCAIFVAILPSREEYFQKDVSDVKKC